jgi:hypothetical protein
MIPRGVISFFLSAWCGTLYSVGRVICDPILHSPVYVCTKQTGELQYCYGIFEIMRLIQPSARHRIMIMKDGKYRLSGDFFRAAVASCFASRAPYFLFYAASVSRARFPFAHAGGGQTIAQLYCDYRLGAWGDDALVLAHDLRTATDTVLGTIEGGKGLLYGADAMNLFSATSIYSFPHISWDMVLYSYVAGILVARARCLIARTQSYPKVSSAYGCGIGYHLV